MSASEESETAQKPHKSGNVKTSLHYWEKHIFKPVVGKKVNKAYEYQAANYAMSTSIHGRRVKLSLGTHLPGAAAKRAQAIYIDLLSLGVDAALERHRPKNSAKGSDASESSPKQEVTIGGWIKAAQEVFEGKPATWGGYVRCLRSIAAEITKAKKSKKRYGRKANGSYQRKIDSTPLSVITSDALKTWRIERMKSAKTPVERVTEKVNADSLMRQASSVFGRDILKHIKNVTIPSPVPFSDAKYYGRQDMRYRSKINVPEFLISAQSELSKTDPEAYKALLLSIAAGLRRGELAGLQWSQIDGSKGLIFLEVTEFTDLKTKDSASDVPIDDELVAILESFRAKARSPFVIEVDAETAHGGKSWGQAYRCDAVFHRLIAWLRAWKQADGSQPFAKIPKPIHTLRKEAGSMVSTDEGIHAAAAFLRHADIQVAARHYVDHKARVTVNITGMLGGQKSKESKS